jgi:peptide/nickel transport system permease protein
MSATAATVDKGVLTGEARRPSHRTGPIPFLKNLFRRRQAQIGGTIILILLLTAAFAPVITSHSPLEVKAGRPLTRPSRDFLFGTDDLGRDMFSRIVFGSRLTLKIGAIIVLLELLIGVTIGLVAGFYGGWVDGLLMRFTDIVLAFPGFILALAVISVLGPGLTNAMLAVGIASLPYFARVVRGSTLSVKEMEYVAAERVLGASGFHIMRKAILPNVLAPIIVLASLEFPAAVLYAAALSFLGLGAQPPTPEWGALLVNARTYIRTAPYLINIPGGAIFFVVLAFNLLGNSLRDVLDPRLQGR